MVVVPAVELAGGDAGEGQPAWLHVPEPSVFRRDGGLQDCPRHHMAPVKSHVVNGKQISKGKLRQIRQRLRLLPQEGQTSGAIQKRNGVLVKKDPVPGLGRAGVIGVVIAVGRNILNHRDSFFLSENVLPPLWRFSPPLSTASGGKGSP